MSSASNSPLAARSLARGIETWAGSTHAFIQRTTWRRWLSVFIAPAPGLDEIHRRHAKSGGEDAVGGDGGAPALEVAEHGHPHVYVAAGDELVGELQRRAAGVNAAVGLSVQALPSGGLRAARALGDDDQREQATHGAAFVDLADDALDVVGDLGEDDAVRAPGEPGV